MATHSHLHSLIRKVLENARKPVPDSFQPTQKWREDLGMDSFALAELAVSIEAETGKNLFSPTLPATVGELEERYHSASDQ